MIHDALHNSSKFLPTEHRLEILENSQKTMEKISDKAKKVGTLQGDTFVKDDLQINKLDYEIFGMK